jgi:type IV secretory pathway TraG/TraD family ATPase VirD4
VRSRRTRHNGEGWFDGERLLVGRDRDGRSVAIPFGGGRGGAHTLLLGATGSGKTVSQTWICVRAIESGRAAIVIDPKGDGDLRTALRAAARAARRRYIEWTPSGPSRYNPYARGSDSAIADRVLAGERFTEPHYQRQAQRYLGHEVRILRRARVPLCLASIVEHLEPERLEQLARTLPEHQAATTHCYLDSLSARQRTDLAGVRDRLAILAESDVGEWLRPGKSFDVLDAVRSRAVVYFDLEADARPLLAQMLGRAVVQDLQSAIAAQQEQPVPAVVALDEFSALGLEQVVGLFARARSAGFSMVLGTQELADLRVGRERVLEQVLGNLSTVIVHRQVLPDSAALVTSLAGTRGAWRGARHSDGRITRTRTSEPVLRADEVMALPAGWAAVIALTDASGAHVTRMFSTRAV